MEETSSLIKSVPGNNGDEEEATIKLEIDDHTHSSVASAPAAAARISLSSFTKEVKRVGSIAGPMVAVSFSQYALQTISTMIVGHLGELALSCTAIAVSFAGVTGFSVLVP
ncbi:hypothetical protein CDL15_Pgr011089 [Punica granatum]|uniref:Uncharacterized protein n=1 Tax=Punica granatum TaxID=22663 RepID=A0A218XLY7_PUNGR|nr:hypothetical protein CDL15_Pgr011089 [Punica granatum]